ncbi:MAG: DUF4870 domain-containing protein [Fimbriimonadaceae bacterium]|nr:DUF4870 domain-containing protein [Fimbriimonadaceae bacterium]
MSTIPPEQDPVQTPAPPTPSFPAAGGASPEEKQQAMLCWILSIFAGFIPGLIFFLIAGDAKPYLKRQGALALTLSIITFVGFIASAILMMILIGFLTYAAFGIWALYVCITGAIACNKGDNFDPAIVSKVCMSIFKL